MVHVSVHGGGCCGARHIHGFGAAEEGSPDLIDNALRQVDRFRMVEVILNGTQVNSRPMILRRLAERGFVLTAHYINGNHNSDNYVFQRCDNRRPLIDDQGNCVIPNWTGPVISPRLEGILPEVSRPDIVGHLYGVPAYAQGYTAPDLVRPVVEFTPRQGGALEGRVVWNGVDFAATDPSFINANTRPIGSLGTLRNYRSNDQYFIQWDNPADENASGENPDIYVNRRQFTVLTDEEALRHPAPPPPQEPHSHDEAPDWQAILESTNLAVDNTPFAPIVVFDPVVVFSTYHNVYRGGRRGAGYDSYAEAVDARRNDGRIDRRDVYSDGTVNWRGNAQ